jgi:hypothetical protein
MLEIVANFLTQIVWPTLPNVPRVTKSFREIIRRRPAVLGLRREYVSFAPRFPPPTTSACFLKKVAPANTLQLPVQVCRDWTNKLAREIAMPTGLTGMLFRSKSDQTLAPFGEPSSVNVKYGRSWVCEVAHDEPFVFI